MLAARQRCWWSRGHQRSPCSFTPHCLSRLPEPKGLTRCATDEGCKPSSRKLIGVTLFPSEKIPFSKPQSHDSSLLKQIIFSSKGMDSQVCLEYNFHFKVWRMELAKRKKDEICPEHRNQVNKWHKPVPHLFSSSGAANLLCWRRFPELSSLQFSAAWTKLYPQSKKLHYTHS